MEKEILKPTARIIEDSYLGQNYLIIYKKEICPSITNDVKKESVTLYYNTGKEFKNFINESELPNKLERIIKKLPEHVQKVIRETRTK